MSYFATIKQDVVVSSGNSSTTNLAKSPDAGYIFVGTAQSTLNVGALQVGLKADQNCIVYIEQSVDGTNWDISDSYKYNVIKDNFGITSKATTSYIRIRVQNLSTTNATTIFRLQTCLLPIGEPLPRSLDPDGHLQVSVEGLNDHFGFSGQYTPMRDQKTITPFRLVGTAFGVTTDTNFWTPTNSGTGSASGVTNAVATISSGTSNSGYGQLKSVRTGRFLFAHPHQFRGAFRLPSTTAALNTRRWGSFTETAQVPQDGVYFEVSATGVLSLKTAKGGSVVNTVTSGSFNGDVTEYVMDTNVHAYEIMYFTMGVWFYIDNVLIHKFTPTTTTMFNTLDTNICITSINTSSGVTNGTIECWNAVIMRLGEYATAPTSKRITTAATTTCKVGSGVLQKITIGDVGTLLTIYDNTAGSGTVLAVISGAKTSSIVTVDYGIPFFTGLTIVSTGTWDAVIIYE